MSEIEGLRDLDWQSDLTTATSRVKVDDMKSDLCGGFMGNRKDLSMAEWVFRMGTLRECARHYGILTLALSPLLVALFAHGAIPTALTQALACFIVAVFLGYPVIVSRKPRDARLRVPVAALSFAFFLMGLLYLLGYLDVRNIVQFDVVSDLLSTACFVAAWLYFTRYMSSADERAAERVAVVFVALLALVAAWIRLNFAAKPAGDPVHEVARLVLNLSNGAILLGFYFQMRRLLPPPDPISNTLILLFGCAQVAAHARNCLRESTCALPTLNALVALSVEWMLLAGKLALGAYLAYAYFEARLMPARAPRAE